MTLERLTETSLEDQLDAVVTEYLESVERGESPDPQYWIQKYPNLAQELAAFFADESRFGQLVAPLRNSGTVAHANVTPDGHASPSPTARRTIQGYDLLEEIGRGGMGVIYKALQRSLNRLVAIKMIRTGEWATPEERLRFRWEAETIAALDHPNIVPIFEIGESSSADGAQLPFFSMKLIEGKNLSQARGQFRNNWQSIAQLMVLVSRAIEHAHQRGILHRDIKPANILLGSKGESGSGFRMGDTFIVPHITDFGLARRAQNPRGQTMPGTIVGTPSYLAPEVARGNEFSTIGSDVYSLGAILYELLTGIPPFQAATQYETIRLVSNTALKLPRKINSAIPLDLETICLKCLETDPAKRYPSADKFAEDLEHYLVGRPISARPIGTLKRFGRWCRRQPVIAGLSAALVLVILISLPLIAVSWRHALDQERLAEDRLKETQLERDRADRGFEQAFSTLEDLFKVLADQPGKESPESEQTKKQMLQNGLGYYRAFVDQGRNDPKLRRKIAQAQFQIGWISGKFGKQREAADNYQNAVDLLRELAREYPDDTFIRDLLAKSLINLGNALNGLNELDTAIKHHEEAAQLARNTGKKPNEAHSIEQSEVIALMNRGVVLQGKENWKGALESFLQAKSVLAKLSDEERKSPSVQFTTIRCLLNLSQAHDRLQQLDEALQTARDGYKLAQEAAKKDGRSEETKFLMAMTSKALGGVQWNRGEQKAGKELLQAAKEFLEDLHGEAPRVTEYAWNLALVCDDLGAFDQKSDPPVAQKNAEQAEALLLDLVERDGESHIYRSTLARIDRLLGNICQNRGDLEGTVKAFERARQQMDYLLKHDSKIGTLRWNMAQTCHQLGVNLRKLQKNPEALAAYIAAAEHYRYLMDQFPDESKYRKSLSSVLGNMAILHRLQRKFGEALEATEKRVELWPNHADELYDGATDFGRTYEALKKIKDGDKELARAMTSSLATLKQAIGAGFKDREKMMNDPAFKDLRDTKEFQGLLK
jgi:serine/threonine protein kinase